MKKYLGSLIEKDVIDDEKKICENCGIPNNKGTVRWAEVKQELNGYFYIPNPINGWGVYTYEQMISGVVNVQEINVLLPEVEDL